MPKYISFLLLIAFIVELVFLTSLMYNLEDLGVVFQGMSSISARISILFFAAAFYLFKRDREKEEHALLSCFAILHFIHLGFLLAHFYIKQLHFDFLTIGGFIAYLMLLSFPFAVRQKKSIKPWMKSTFYYYIWIVITQAYFFRIYGSMPNAYASKVSQWSYFVFFIGLVVWHLVYLKRNKVQCA